MATAATHNLTLLDMPGFQQAIQLRLMQKSYSAIIIISTPTEQYQWDYLFCSCIRPATDAASSFC